MSDARETATPSQLTGVEVRVALIVISLATLLMEILLTRVLSLVMWYHFTFAVLSAAMLGIAAGAMYAYRARPVPSRVAAVSALTLFGLACAIPVILMTLLVATPSFSVTGFALLCVYFAACSAPFVASGYLTAVVFRESVGGTSSLYAIDLIAAALGCLLAIPLLDLLGGAGSLLAVAALTTGTATVLALRGGEPSKQSLAITLALVLGLIGTQAAPNHIDIRSVKFTHREQLRRIVTVKWNSYSRLALLDYYDPDAKSPFPFLSWGLSDRYQGPLPRQYLVTIDGSSETPITEWKGDLADQEYVAWDVTAAPYVLRPGGKTLVIGAGGGRDLLTAMYFGSKDVTGVELNRGIYDWVTGEYADFAGHVYDRPGVRVHVDDGRNFVRSTDARYDVLQISMIDTFAATAAGAYTLSENNLYTAQAFDAYLSHLAPGGVLALNRFLVDPPQQALRTLTLAREALERRGVTDAASHIAVLRKDSPLGDIGVVLVKNEPFSSADLDSLMRWSDDRQFTSLAIPGRNLGNAYAAYLTTPDTEAFYRDYPFDVRPPTDDRPFFFNTIKLENILEGLQLRQQVDATRRYNLDAVFILFALVGLAAMALAGFVFGPLVRRRPDELLPTAHLVYFVGVGLGFILVEMVFIQRFNLYLGHPVYSLAVILVSVLAFSGAGSALTARIPDHRVPLASMIACLAAGAGVVLGEAAWATAGQATLGLPMAWRVGFTVLAIAPLGLLLGMPSPLGVRAVSLRTARAVPWVWAVNSAATVLGSILAFLLAMAMGFHAALLIGAACYVAAAVASGVARREPSPLGQPA